MTVPTWNTTLALRFNWVAPATAPPDSPGDAFRCPALVADRGLDYFAAETRHARRAMRSLAAQTP